MGAKSVPQVLDDTVMVHGGAVNEPASFETGFSLLRVRYRKRSVSNAVLLQLNFCICVKWCAIRVLFEFASMGERKVPRWESHMA